MAGELRVLEVELPRTVHGHVDIGAIRNALGDVEVLETAGDGRDDGWSYASARRVGGFHVTAGGAGRHLDAPGEEPGARSLQAVAAGWSVDADPLALLDAMCSELGLTPDAGTTDRGLPAFTGGWVGVLSHDLARHVERLPDRLPPSDQPDVDLRLVDTVLAWRADGDAALLVHRDLGWAPPDLAGLAGRIAAAGAGPRLGPAPPPATAVSSLGRAGHHRAVVRALEHIAAGDTFQVNVTHQLRAPWPGDAWSLYRRLRSASPAAYGALVPHLADRGGDVASISPETFLAVDGRRVRVRPIKGTRPRHVDDPVADRAAARELEASSKDRAENVMVVDMERNDLGRVCEVGTVRAPRLLDVERHPTVWHLVSTVEGTLRPDVGWGGLLRATFPCGSVTGTPKVRALELIEEIEPVRRGVYCGAVGFLSAGAAHTSVAIRTAVLAEDGTATYGTGGGIVADSDPDDEWRESLDKAAAFFTATNTTLREDQR